ncbi:MAG: CoA transferase, partial [Candidatus Binatia bacterium]
FLNAPATSYLATGESPGPDSRPRSSQTYAFTGSDGLPFAIHLSSPPKFWEGLARASGHPELIEDKRFKTRADRQRNYLELQQTLGMIMKEKPRSYWLERLEAEDVPHTPVYNMAELFQDPHLKHMGMEIEIPRGERAPIRTVRFPIDYGNTPSPHPGPPPDLGQHTQELLTALGYDPDRIAILREKGVI